MSKGVRRVLGVVAAIAVPFIAAPIAGALAGSAALKSVAGGAIAGAFTGAKGAALVGAGLGAAGAALSGQNVLTGAALGGLGGFTAGGGFRGMFGGAQGAGAAGQAGQAAVPGIAQGATGAGLGAAAPGIATGAVPGAATAAGTAATGLGGFFRSVGQGILNNPAGVAQLALTVYGRSPQDLTAAEQAHLEELRGLAATNQQLFEQRVSEANRLLQMAGQVAPNPEQAFAQYQIGAQRQLSDQTRGMSRAAATGEQRRTAIRATQAGATAAAAEEARGRQAQLGFTQAGLAAMPTSAPQGYAGLAMPTYDARQERRDAYYRDLARAGGDLFGGTRPRREEDEDERRAGVI